MTAIAIDLDMLNELLDNQKKLDDVFDSMFDDDPFLSTTASNSHARQNNTQKSKQSFDSSKDFSFNMQEKDQGLARIVIPVVIEIAVICYGIFYFS